MIATEVQLADPTKPEQSSPTGALRRAADLAQVVQGTDVDLAAVQQKQPRRRRPDHRPLDGNDLLILMVGAAPAYR